MVLGASAKTSLLLGLLLTAFVSASHAGEIEDSQTIGLFSGEEPVASSSTIPRPTSKIAENVTVITADDILRLNAHTLAEVLQTVPGIQLDLGYRTPGTFTFFNIQGALNSTVLVLVDGIRQNDFDQDIASPAMIPVQQIERIEIVKGAASGSWGSALGGVVNIVTKSPDPDRPLSAMVSGSIGSRFTTDSRGELSGTSGKVGYYLTAGRLSSDGLSPDTAHTVDNLYGKLSYTLPGEGTVTLGVSRQSGEGGEGEGVVPRANILLREDSRSRHSYGFLGFQQPLAGSFALELQGYLTDHDDSLTNRIPGSSGAFEDVNRFTLSDYTRGLRANLSWGDSRNNFVTGVEYLHGHGSARDQLGGAPPVYDRTWDSYALYLGGTCSLGDLAVIPGVRFDSTGLSGNHMSYTLGLTYQLTERTTLRAYAAEGFSLPMLIFDDGTQRVKTVQAGVETGAVPFLWLKATYFLNMLRNVQSLGTVASAASTNENRQGFELEGRTTPFFGLSLGGGYTFLYAEDIDSGGRLKTNGRQTVPPQVYKLSLYYDNAEAAVGGALTGSGAVWNEQSGFPARSDFMLWDLSLHWKPALPPPLTPELFFTAHNLFNGVQTVNTFLGQSATRWYEGGARFRF